MIRSFRDAATEDVFEDMNTTAARRLPRNLWPVIRRRLDYLHAASRLDQLVVHRLEALKGNQRGRYSIRVNRQYRITFRFDAGHANEVHCEDYH